MSVTSGGQSKRTSGAIRPIQTCCLPSLYHYRTRTHRVLLWLPTAITLSCILLPALTAQASIPSEPGAARFLGRVGTAAGAATVWGWWRYYHASVRISSRGITQYTWRGRRFIPWDQVRDFYQSDEHGTVASDHGRVRFWLTIADVEELKDEIARRAINCRGKGWEKRQTRP